MSKLTFKTVPMKEPRRGHLGGKILGPVGLAPELSLCHFIPGDGGLAVYSPLLPPPL